MRSPRTDRTIVLCGLPGSGKTTVGRALAARLGWRFVDLDQQIVETSGRSILEWFGDHGEPAFRSYEAEQLAASLSPRTVLALGGGALGAASSRALVEQDARLVHLAASIEVLLSRLNATEVASRPLLTQDESLTARLTRLAREREAHYRHAELRIVVDQRSVEEVAAILEARLRAPRLEVFLPDTQYPILFAPDETWLADELRQHAPATKICLISDETVAALHGERYRQALSQLAQIEVLSVPPGEESKSWSTAGALLEQLATRAFTRDSVVVALGGGVVGDLAGFVASTFARGVRLVQIPTTVLAQVDSSVGGKTGVNLPAGKNLAGTFHQPRLVYVDASTLTTLPERDRRAGLAEMVKHALLDSAEHLAALEAAAPALAAGQLDLLPPLVRASCAFKALVVAADELEQSDAPDGGRAQLNFGHTLGHALEAASHQTFAPLRHGEAVALGLVAALDLGVRLGTTPSALRDRAVALLERLGLPIDYAPRLRTNTSDAIGFLLRDKKNRHDRNRAAVRFVLLEEIGRPRLVPLDLERIEHAFAI